MEKIQKSGVNLHSYCHVKCEDAVIFFKSTWADQQSLPCSNHYAVCNILLQVFFTSLIVFQPIPDPEMKIINPAVVIHYLLSHLINVWLLSEEHWAMTEVLWAKLGDTASKPL